MCVVERLVQSVMVWELMGVMSVSGKYRKEEDVAVCVMDEGLGKLQDFPLLVKAMCGLVLWNQMLVQSGLFSSFSLCFFFCRFFFETPALVSWETPCIFFTLLCMVLVNPPLPVLSRCRFLKTLLKG